MDHVDIDLVGRFLLERSGHTVDEIIGAMVDTRFSYRKVGDDGLRAGLPNFALYRTRDGHALGNGSGIIDDDVHVFTWTASDGCEPPCIWIAGVRVPETFAMAVTGQDLRLRDVVDHPLLAPFSEARVTSVENSIQTSRVRVQISLDPEWQRVDLTDGPAASATSAIRGKHS